MEPWTATDRRRAAAPSKTLCRKKFVEALRERFADLGMEYSIGGQISFDVFPKVGGVGGWVGLPV